MNFIYFNLLIYLQKTKERVNLYINSYFQFIIIFSYLNLAIHFESKISQIQENLIHPILLKLDFLI